MAQKPLQSFIDGEFEINEDNMNQTEFDSLSKIDLSISHIDDSLSMLDSIYNTVSELDTIETDTYEQIARVYAAVDSLYDFVEEKFGIVEPEIADEVEAYSEGTEEQQEGIDEAVKARSEWGYYGSVNLDKLRQEAYELMHARVLKLAMGYPIIKSANKKQQEFAIINYLDSSHGRHLADQGEGVSDAYITKDFGYFLKHNMKFADLFESLDLEILKSEKKKLNEDAKRYAYATVIKKLKDGVWDASTDVKPRAHLEVTVNSGAKGSKKMTIWVEADETPIKLGDIVNEAKYIPAVLKDNVKELRAQIAKDEAEEPLASMTDKTWIKERKNDIATLKKWEAELVKLGIKEETELDESVSANDLKKMGFAMVPPIEWGSKRMFGDEVDSIWSRKKKDGKWGTLIISLNDGDWQIEKGGKVTDVSSKSIKAEVEKLSAIKEEAELVEAASDVSSALKKAGFSDAKDVKVDSIKGLDWRMAGGVKTLYGLKMRADKWADVWVAEYDDGEWTIVTDGKQKFFDSRDIAGAINKMVAANKIVTNKADLKEEEELDNDITETWDSSKLRGKSKSDIVKSLKHFEDKLAANKNPNVKDDLEKIIASLKKQLAEDSALEEEEELSEGTNFGKLSDEKLIAWLEKNWSDDQPSPVFGAELKRGAEEAKKRKLKWTMKEDLTEGIVDFTGFSPDQMKKAIAKLKDSGHSPNWEDTTRLSSKNPSTVSAMNKLKKQMMSENLTEAAGDHGLLVSALKKKGFEQMDMVDLHQSRSKIKTPLSDVVNAYRNNKGMFVLFYADEDVTIVNGEKVKHATKNVATQEINQLKEADLSEEAAKKICLACGEISQTADWIEKDGHCPACDLSVSGTEQPVFEGVVKLACLECDEVSTEGAWKKNKGFCPKCKKSSQAVREEIEFQPDTIEETAIESGLDKSKRIVAIGHKGPDSKTWRRVFADGRAWDKWNHSPEASDVELKRVYNESWTDRWLDAELQVEEVRSQEEIILSAVQFFKEETESTDPLLESVDAKIIRRLSTTGLVDDSDVTKLTAAFKALAAEKQLSASQRQLIGDLVTNLVLLISGDQSIFNKVKTSSGKFLAAKDLTTD